MCLGHARVTMRKLAIAAERLALNVSSDNQEPVIPSEGAKRRSRGIAVVLAEWLSMGTAAL